jgi:signal peptidase I
MRGRLSQNRRLRLRRAVNQGILLLALWLLLETWCLEGFFIPLHISGPSMAPALCGRRRELICGDCGFSFAGDTDRPPISPRAVCPNCGFPLNDLAAQTDLPGERILIDRATFNFRPPRRWEVIAFRPPAEAETTAVKRVVGLPGETVKIHQGDVWVNGQIVRKSLEQQRALLIPVYDARFPTKSDRPPRWQGLLPPSEWRLQGDRFVHPRLAVAGTAAQELPQTRADISADAELHELDPRSPAIDWLVYRHWRRMAGADAVQVGPVDDVFPYNQNLPYREENVHPVADLFLTFRLVEVSGKGVFWIRAGDGRDVIQTGIDLQQKKLHVYLNEQENAVQEIAAPLRAGQEIEVSLIDRQFLLAFDGQTVCRLPLESRVQPSSGTPEPFAVGSENLEIVLDSAQIFRDVYYTQPLVATRVQGDHQPSALGENEFFVLGDNSAVSEDSRNGSPHPAIEEQYIVGKPLIAAGCQNPLQGGKYRFPIPIFTRFRWIR